MSWLTVSGLGAPGDLNDLNARCARGDQAACTDAARLALLLQQANIQANAQVAAMTGTREEIAALNARQSARSSEIQSIMRRYSNPNVPAAPAAPAAPVSAPRSVASGFVALAKSLKPDWVSLPDEAPAVSSPKRPAAQPTHDPRYFPLPASRPWDWKPTALGLTGIALVLFVLSRGGRS